MIKKLIKSILKPLIPPSIKVYIRIKRGLFRKYGFKNTLKSQVILTSKKCNRLDDYVRQMNIICSKIQIDDSSYFIYPYDPLLIRVLPNETVGLTSITVDYKTILDSNLNDILNKLSLKKNSSFVQTEVTMINVIKLLIDRIQLQLQKSKNNRANVIASYIGELLYRKPYSLEEAIQKILLYNALFWQARHYHNGLGRLDMILYEYYKNDIDKGTLSHLQAKNMLKQMCLILGKDVKYKSVLLLGDTGQYILLGGIDQNGKTIQNELTDVFLEIFTELKVPDPKLILRTNSKTSHKVWQNTIQCILSGCGSPLLMNEDIIMNSMVEFGYKNEDVWNLGTSACWEPLIIGKSFDQNNPLPNIPVIEPLNQLLLNRVAFNEFEELLSYFKVKLERVIVDTVCDINFDCSPLYTLFFDSCIEKEKDYTMGGADYAYHGVQIVSFPNLINALLNIKYLVFEKRLFSLNECSEALNNNFEGYEEMYNILMSNPYKFGSNSSVVIDLTNNLMSFIGDVIHGLKVNGKKIKVGFSSPSYLISSRKVGASLDGRKSGEPFAVHISPVSKNIGIQEIVEFATSLNYSNNRINGNVVDYIIPTSFMKNPDKLEVILKDGMNKGIFELQLNVLDAEILKDAKLHPEKYPNLVVRVWGFSAYFNDLPIEYKDNLIKRAENYA